MMRFWNWLKTFFGFGSPVMRKTAVRGGQIFVSDFLSDQTIIFFDSGPSKQQVLGRLIAALELSDPSKVLQAILAREEIGSTQIAPGISLPHARLPGLKNLKAALGICKSGVMDSSRQDHPIQLFFLFVGPSDNMSLHLAFLASVSAFLQDGPVMESLMAMNTPQEVYRWIQQQESKRSIFH